MSGVIALIVSAISLGTFFARQDQPAPVAPREWVAFSADLRINIPDRPEAWGRYVQDEHGCVRQETVHPDGSALITITNFQTEHFYFLFRGSWTSQRMRMGPEKRRPIQRSVSRKTASIEGFDAYVSGEIVRSPGGDYKREATLIPALNYFEAVNQAPTGERRTAVNIRIGPQPHDQFVPPPGTGVVEAPGFGGHMSFSVVVLRIEFASETPIEAETTEETAYAVKTPSGLSLTIVTSVVDSNEKIVSIRILDHATGSPGNVRGDLLDEVQVALGATGQTTKIGETFSITVTRIGAVTK